MTLFPFLAWLAVVTSAALLASLYASGDLGRGSLSLMLGWSLVAAYCQFFGASAAIAAGGLALQTVLAVYLIIRWKAGG